LEASGDNTNASSRYLFDRFTTWLTSPEYNWNYTTSKQPQLRNRQINYVRGKGLSGCSAINFCVWTVGPSEDYERWASIVQDQRFNWSNARRRYNKIETYHSIDEKLQAYLKIDPSQHGHGGPVQVQFPREMEDFLPIQLQNTQDYGWPICADVNSGNPIGIALCPPAAYEGTRVTAASAYLEPPQSNLTVKTHSQVIKILFKDKHAIGVETLNRDQC
jgi:choline dehydrogenase-like flavoprotein